MSKANTGRHRDVSKLLLAPKFGGVKQLSMGMNVTEVGSMIPDHSHEESEEVLFLISGRAKLVIEGQGEWEIGPETAFYSPLGVKHRLENIGDEPPEAGLGVLPSAAEPPRIERRFSSTEETPCSKRHETT